MSAYGERVVARYLKHPPAASQVTADADALDSGSGMVADSNVTTLGIESPRLLVETIGPGSRPGYQNPGDAWAGLADTAAPPAGSLATLLRIPYDRRTAARFGPRPLIADRDDATSGLVVPRTIRFRMAATLDASLTSADAVFALTATSSPRDILEDRALATATVSFGGTGARVVTADLSPASPLAGALYEPITSGDGGDAYIVPGWLWFGWVLEGTTNASTIDSLCAWEIRA